MGKFKLLCQDILNEKLGLDFAKKISRNWDKSKYDSWFGKGIYRLYFDIKGDEITDEITDNSKNVSTSIYQQIKSILEKNDYEIENFDAGLAKKKGTNKNFIKIGKLLQKFNAIELKKQYDLMQDKTSKVLKTTENNYLVVISRHPYDIAGMSTDREWRYCMRLDPKTGNSPSDYGYNTNYNENVFKFIKENSLIAYIIKSNDKNIQKPIGRTLIVPYYSEDKKSTYLYPSLNVYGKRIPNFREIIQKWLDEKQGKINSVFYYPSNLYNDGNPKLISK
jgi:hypothetical protein